MGICRERGAFQSFHLPLRYAATNLAPTVVAAPITPVADAAAGAALADQHLTCPACGAAIFGSRGSLEDDAHPWISSASASAVAALRLDGLMSRIAGSA